MNLKEVILPESFFDLGPQALCVELIAKVVELFLLLLQGPLDELVFPLDLGTLAIPLDL
jgi:hypothetical protein